jgi:hypothetical protein
VRTVLTNEKYIGNNVFNRRSFKLKKLHVDNPPEMWIRKEGAFEAIVPIEIFMTAQEIITARSAKLSDEELLEHLRCLYAEHGQISGVLIDQSDALPSANMYRTRFGSLRRAYALIGYQTNFDHERAEINARLRAMYPEIVQGTLTQIDAIGGAVTQAPDTGLLNINNELVVSLVLSRCQTSGDGKFRWRVRFDPERFNADLSLVVRLNHYNESALDYYLLPWLDLPRNQLAIDARSATHFEAFRFDDLQFFYRMACRVNIWRQAS